MSDVAAPIIDEDTDDNLGRFQGCTLPRPLDLVYVGERRYRVLGVVWVEGTDLYGGTVYKPRIQVSAVRG